MATPAPDALFLRVLETLDENQARWCVAQEALARGRGGVSALSRLTGFSRNTITKGIVELHSRRALPAERIRRPGAGRPRLEATDPEMERALLTILEETTAGDPMSPLRWTSKSATRIAEELSRQGHPVSHATMDRRLRTLGYSLQANLKTKEGTAPPERDAQFRYINEQVRKVQARGDPVLSVDAKKKERVGEFKNPGRTWRPKGTPEEVNIYDYPDLGEGPAIPYGVYDVQRNHGFVNVGMDHETAEFAVESLRRWWRLVGRRHYGEAKGWLICADGGGSNGSRRRGWKWHLQRLADEVRKPVTVCHYPPGTSKWNKIEHRLFSQISLTWRGQPLVSYEAVVNLIGNTRTATGLTVKAMLDRSQYDVGEKVTDEEMRGINLREHEVHPKWNYTISPH
ncbi:MAG: ISAzo13 family transposase [Thermoplasmata archaeon]